MRPFSVVLLAAGGSSRLGRPKQLVEIDGQPLIRRAVSVAMTAAPLEVIVVLGAFAEEVSDAVAANSFADQAEPVGPALVRLVVNEQWQEGMGGSIRKGVETVDPASEALVLMLCDQPSVDGDLLKTLIESLTEDRPIAATEYEGRAGAPCALLRSVFLDLLRLRGDQGARDLIRDPHRNVARVPFASAALDLDTEDDLARWTGDAKGP